MYLRLHTFRLEWKILLSPSLRLSSVLLHTPVFVEITLELPRIPSTDIAYLLLELLLSLAQLGRSCSSRRCYPPIFSSSFSITYHETVVKSVAFPKRPRQRQLAATLVVLFAVGLPLFERSIHSRDFYQGKRDSFLLPSIDQRDFSLPLSLYLPIGFDYITLAPLCPRLVKTKKLSNSTSIKVVVKSVRSSWIDFRSI